MSLKFPGFEKENAHYLFEEVGRYSKFIHIFSTTPSADNGRRYHVSINAPHPSEMHAVSSLSIHDIDDLLAIHRVLQEMIDMKERMERGEVVGVVEISAKSKKFTFTLCLDSVDSLSFSMGEDGNLKKNNPRPRSPSTNNICVSIQAGRKHIAVGSIGFYGGLRSALLLAHDLEVVMALLKGTPPLEIMKMRPKTPANPFPQAELEESRSANILDINWDEIHRRREEESAYMHDLRKQVEAELESE